MLGLYKQYMEGKEMALRKIRMKRAARESVHVYY